VLRHPDFVAGDFDTSFVETAFAAAPVARVQPVEAAAIAAAIRLLRARSSQAAPAAGEAGGSWRLAGRQEAQGRLGSRG
jgi:hypothetical protein